MRKVSSSSILIIHLEYCSEVTIHHRRVSICPFDIAIQRIYLYISLVLNDTSSQQYHHLVMRRKLPNIVCSCTVELYLLCSFKVNYAIVLDKLGVLLVMRCSKSS